MDIWFASSLILIHCIIWLVSFWLFLFHPSSVDLLHFGWIWFVHYEWCVSLWCILVHSHPVWILFVLVHWIWLILFDLNCFMLVDFHSGSFDVIHWVHFRAVLAIWFVWLWLFDWLDFGVIRFHLTCSIWLMLVEF